MTLPNRTIRIFIGAGEVSGDRLAAALVQECGKLRPDNPISFEGWGGPRMAAAGVVLLERMERYTVMGLWEVVGSLWAHRRLEQLLVKRLREHRFDLVVLVDYSEFHLRLAEKARRLDIPILIYVAPQAWAWRPSRVDRLAKLATKLAVILPFEESYFRDRGVPAVYVGSPLLGYDSIERSTARRKLGIGARDRVLALFPGSRHQEVHRLWSALRRTGQELLESGEIDRAIAVVPHGIELDNPGSVEVVVEHSRELMAAADWGVVKSGTTTLEAAIAGLPMVVVYRAHPISVAVARTMVKLPYFSLVNLIAQEKVVPELLQRDVTSGNLVRFLRTLMAPGGEATERQRRSFADIRERLGSTDASRRTAELMLEMIGG